MQLDCRTQGIRLHNASAFEGYAAMTNYKMLAIFAGVTAGVFLCLMYWYQWSARPLTQSQVESYMSQIDAQSHNPGGKHDMRALRGFLESDDGKPIYTVNLYKFHAVADYPHNSGFSGSGEEAYERFSKVMVSLMTKRGSHPIYGSNWADASSDWDRVVVVRYRSRADLVDLFATDAFAEASLHKWASIREHNRMIVQATHIPDGRYIFIFLAVMIGFATLWVSRVILR